MVEALDGCGMTWIEVHSRFPGLRKAGSAHRVQEMPIVPNRRTRRRRQRTNAVAKAAAGGPHQNGPTCDAAPASSSSVTSARTPPREDKRLLPAHLWHAKRFVMVMRGGWKVPAHKCGKGKRSRSLARAATAAAVLSDTSHFSYVCVSAASSEHLVAVLTRALRLPDHASVVAQRESTVSASLLLDLLENPGQFVLECFFAADKVAGPCMMLTEQGSLVTTLLESSGSMKAGAARILAVLRVHSLIAREAINCLREMCREQAQGELSPCTHV